MDPIRAFQIYVVQLGSGFFYLIIFLLVLRRDTKRLNQIFSGYFLCVFIGAVLNVIYASLNINPTVLILHFLTWYFFTFGFVFLLIFNLIILLSEKRMTSQKQLIIIIIYAIILFSVFFIPEGIKIDDSTGWKPVWSLLFLISVLIILSITIV